MVGLSPACVQPRSGGPYCPSCAHVLKEAAGAGNECYGRSAGPRHSRSSCGAQARPTMPCYRRRAGDSCAGGVAPGARCDRPIRRSRVLEVPPQAWPTDARMHPAEGMRMCWLGCPGSPDDLRHYLSCHRLWTPVLSSLRMAPQPNWEQHLGLVGDLAQRVAVMRAWLAAFRTYMVLRRGDGITLRDAVGAG